FAWTRQGKPSQVGQRTHVLYGMFASFSRMPHGAWNGWKPGAARASGGGGIRGSGGAAGGDVGGELLDPVLVGDRGDRVRCARRRLGRIFTASAVDLVELLGLRVVGLGPRVL